MINTHDTADRVPRHGNWLTYFNGLSGPQAFFRAQADEYVRNLAETVSVDRDARVLDFGSGYGFVAEVLASRVGELFVWDSSATMRHHLQRLARLQPNVHVLDLSDNTVGALAAFDLILVNSTAQYMPPEEFGDWLHRWASMLAPSGRLVISDLIPPGHSLVGDMADLLTFTARRGQARNAVVWAARKLGRYRRVKGTSPLRHISLQELTSMADAAGLSVARLPHNLTHFRKRYSVVLTRFARD